MLHSVYKHYTIFLKFSVVGLGAYWRQDKLIWDAQFGSLNSRTGPTVTPENSKASSTENSPPWDAVCTHMFKTFVVGYERRWVNIIATTACHRTLHWARCIKAASWGSTLYSSEIQVVTPHRLIRRSGNISYNATTYSKSTGSPLADDPQGAY